MPPSIVAEEHGTTFRVEQHGSTPFSMWKRDSQCQQRRLGEIEKKKRNAALAATYTGNGQSGGGRRVKAARQEDTASRRCAPLRPLPFFDSPQSAFVTNLRPQGRATHSPNGSGKGRSTRDGNSRWEEKDGASEATEEQIGSLTAVWPADSPCALAGYKQRSGEREKERERETRPFSLAALPPLP